jgi:benzoyl-CoA reductase/2-hydroxyglutaryl-CoA dehydratase subunit BcrC/BadD/HgdB
MDNCSVLYDPDKKRADLIVSTAKSRGAKGVIVVLTKFCDPEEFDYVIIKKACDTAGLPVLLIEVDRQMVNYAQAKTALETFKEVFTVK